MCVQVTKTANRFEISSLLEKILLKQVRWCLTFVGLYIIHLSRRPPKFIGPRLQPIEPIGKSALKTPCKYHLLKKNYGNFSEAIASLASMVVTALSHNVVSSTPPNFLNKC